MWYDVLTNQSICVEDEVTSTRLAANGIVKIILLKLILYIYIYEH